MLEEKTTTLEIISSKCDDIKQGVVIPLVVITSSSCDYIKVVVLHQGSCNNIKSAGQITNVQCLRHLTSCCGLKPGTTAFRCEINWEKQSEEKKTTLHVLISLARALYREVVLSTLSLSVC